VTRVTDFRARETYGGDGTERQRKESDIAKQRNRIRRVLRKRALLLRVALAVTAASLAIPAAAGAYTVAGGFTGATGHHGAQSPPRGTATVGTTEDGFDGGEAMIGAGGALALIAFVGAGGLTIRSRRRLGSAAPTHG